MFPLNLLKHQESLNGFFFFMQHPGDPGYNLGTCKSLVHWLTALYLSNKQSEAILVGVALPY